MPLKSISLASNERGYSRREQDFPRGCGKRGIIHVFLKLSREREREGEKNDNEDLMKLGSFLVFRIVNSPRGVSPREASFKTLLT